VKIRKRALCTKEGERNLVRGAQDPLKLRKKRGSGWGVRITRKPKAKRKKKEKTLLRQTLTRKGKIRWKTPHTRPGTRLADEKEGKDPDVFGLKKPGGKRKQRLGRRPSENSYLDFSKKSSSRPRERAGPRPCTREKKKERGREVVFGRIGVLSKKRRPYGFAQGETPGGERNRAGWEASPWEQRRG